MRARRLGQALLLGYLAGTFPTGDLVARRASGGTIDLRSAGSGNPGGANARQVLGARYGYAVMAADIGKGAVSCAAGRLLAGPAGANLAGTAAVVGHCYPVWSGFRGGKGVGASVGQCLANFPAYFPIDVGVAAVTAASPWWRRRAFAATVTASVTWVGAGLLWWAKGWRNLWGPRPTASLPLSAALSSAVIAWRFVAADRAAGRR